MSPTPLAERAAPATCAHCELPVPAGRPAHGGLAFCCRGCETVHDLLAQAGLTRYYELRAAVDATPQAVVASDRAYGELDDPSFLAQHCTQDQPDLCSTEFTLENVHCAACVWLIEKLPRLVPGVVQARLDLGRARARVTWRPDAVPLSQIARQLDRLGYPPHPFHAHRSQAQRQREDRAMLVKIGIAGAVFGNVMAIAFALYGGLIAGMEPEFRTLFRWASLAVTLPSLIFCGSVFFRGAWGALRARSLHMDLPISIGILAGFVHGTVNTVRGSGEVYFDSLTALIFLLLVGRYLLNRRGRIAADAAELLAALAPSSARVIEADAVREVPLDTLTPGQLVEVRAGDVIPADGVIVGGASALDMRLLTGEARPQRCAAGQRVHAGTLNVSSRLVVQIESTGRATRVGRLMALVEEAGQRRAPVVRLADRLAGWFVAVVLVLAAITALIWWRIAPERAIDHVVAVLVITCPCALGLATPLAVAAAVGKAARRGLLVKGADVLEGLTRPGRIWLDKTGTLTAGRQQLVRWIGDARFKPLVAALERESAHPVARALVAALSPAPVCSVEAVQERQGAGIAGSVDGVPVVIGSPAFVRGQVPQAVLDLDAAVSELVDDSLTPVAIAVDGTIVAVLGIGDVLRDDAPQVVTHLTRAGWRVGILSGDDPRVVQQVGAQLGLDRTACLGGVSPEEKLRIVHESRAQGPVVMVGDGVNDAAALAAATVGIGVHGGAEAALTAADVFVTRDGLAPLVELFQGAGRTLGVVRRNLAISLAYNVVGVSLAMAGLVNPLVAAILMPASSLTVIIASYRSRTFER